MDNCRLSAILQQIVEGVRVQKVEGSYYHTGRQKTAILAYTDASHSGGTGGFDAVLRVFYNDAMLGRDTQFDGGDEEHFRVRLAPVYILSGHDGLKAAASV